MKNEKSMVPSRTRNQDVSFENVCVSSRYALIRFHLIKEVQKKKRILLSFGCCQLKNKVDVDM